jgi:hypothetical protein
LEFQSPSRRIFIGSHSLPPLSGRLIGPSSFEVEGTIEVHYLVFRPLLGRGHLDFCPLRHEVCEDLRLDHLMGAKLDFKFSKLNRPLDDAVVGVAVVDDLS